MTGSELSGFMPYLQQVEQSADAKGDLTGQIKSLKSHELDLPVRGAMLEARKYLKSETLHQWCSLTLMHNEQASSDT